MDAAAIRAFLTARYDEEEHAARDGLANPSWRRIYWLDADGRQESDVVPEGVAYSRRVLREVEAKRRFLTALFTDEQGVERVRLGESGRVETCMDDCAPLVWWLAVKTFAQSWADHPDFPEELRLSD